MTTSSNEIRPPASAAMTQGNRAGRHKVYCLNPRNYQFLVYFFLERQIVAPRQWFWGKLFAQCRAGDSLTDPQGDELPTETTATDHPGSPVVAGARPQTDRRLTAD